MAMDAFATTLATTTSHETTNNHKANTNPSGTDMISSHHSDYILAMALDLYGRRMVTASGDRTVRLWELQQQQQPVTNANPNVDDEDDQNGTMTTTDASWVPLAVWQAHRSAVTAVAWAHPEFGGGILATAGADQDVKIWEEASSSSSSGSSSSSTAAVVHTTNNTNNNNINSNNCNSRWNCTASLTDARRAVTCLEFAPRQYGLKLATGSADGTVRLYEALDIMNLAVWSLAASLDSTNANTNNSTSDYVVVEGGGGASFSSGCTCLSWCTGRFDPPTLAAGGSSNNFAAAAVVLLYRYSDAARAWQVALAIPMAVGVDILDVAWAPNVGRRFHALAIATTMSSSNKNETNGKIEEQESEGNTTTSLTATKDNDWSCSNLKVVHLSREINNPNKEDASVSSNNNNSNNVAPTNSAPSASASISIVSQQDLFTPHDVWRCQWNVTGTVLASSGEYGAVHLYKRDEDGVYCDVAEVQGNLNRIATTAPTANQ